MNIRAARVKFIEEGFEYENCLIFDVDGLLAFSRKQRQPVCTIFAAYDVQILKGTKFLLPLALAF